MLDHSINLNLNFNNVNENASLEQYDLINYLLNFNKQVEQHLYLIKKKILKLSYPNLNLLNY